MTHGRWQTHHTLASSDLTRLTVCTTDQSAPLCCSWRLILPSGPAYDTHGVVGPPFRHRHISQQLEQHVVRPPPMAISAGEVHHDDGSYHQYAPQSCWLTHSHRSCWHTGDIEALFTHTPQNSTTTVSRGVVGHRSEEQSNIEWAVRPGTDPVPVGGVAP